MTRTSLAPKSWLFLVVPAAVTIAAITESPRADLAILAASDLAAIRGGHDCQIPGTNPITVCNECVNKHRCGAETTYGCIPYTGNPNACAACSTQNATCSTNEYSYEGDGCTGMSTLVGPCMRTYTTPSLTNCENADRRCP